MILVRKDGSSSQETQGGGAIDRAAVGHHSGEHPVLRAEGFQTMGIISGAVLCAREILRAKGMDDTIYSHKLLAMMGMDTHFGIWREEASKHGLTTVSSLTTEVEMAREGKEIKSGLHEALTHEELLLLGNYHDEASSKEMVFYMKRYLRFRNRVQRLLGIHRVLQTESEENDFHAANTAEAIGADMLMLCTTVDGFYVDGHKRDIIHLEEVKALLKHCEAGSASGTGGMRTKLLAAEQFVRRTGKQSVIGDSFADSRRILYDNAGTWVVQ